MVFPIGDDDDTGDNTTPIAALDLSARADYAAALALESAIPNYVHPSGSNETEKKKLMLLAVDPYQWLNAEYDETRQVFITPGVGVSQINVYDYTNLVGEPLNTAGLTPPATGALPNKVLIKRPSGAGAINTSIWVQYRLGTSLLETIGYVIPETYTP
jgi:hypothetical protein